MARFSCKAGYGAMSLTKKLQGLLTKYSNSQVPTSVLRLSGAACLFTFFISVDEVENAMICSKYNDVAILWFLSFNASAL